MWMSLREHVLSERTALWLNLSLTSKAASSVLLMDCVGGIEATKTLREEREELRIGG
jgi:hypothetical protein